MRRIDFAEVMGTRWSEEADDFARECIEVGGPAFTAFTPDGVPAVIGGVTLMSPGVGSAWCVGTEEWPSVAIEVTRVARKIVNELMRDGCHRIQALSADFHTVSHRWLEVVGFQREATLVGAGKHGNDYYLYAKVSDDVRIKWRRG